VNYTWTDICATAMGFPYEFPCARLSPMDLFREANWFMDYKGPDSISEDPYIPAPKQDLYRRTWYHEIVRKQLIKPLLPRVNILLSQCIMECFAMVEFRVNSSTPLALLSDLVNLVCLWSDFTVKHEFNLPSF
jgi:hypothetical protein